MRCPACAREISEAAAFCPSCGKPVDPQAAMPTMDTPAPHTPSTSPVSHTPSEFSSSLTGETGLAPGQMFSGRYRIVGLLGRGGMGEVYRAEDLKLGQQVALKFLHKKHAQDTLLLNRFVSEVRLARQIAHPNVCRVYDIGDSDSYHYLAMEYVDGEDLATLLKRIGRFPPDKALEIAQQLCAGLAAAHERGVLHRDLKPANVMIDGRGRARIMDFGLALPVEHDAAKGQVAGTPAYMAPEQLSGGAVSIQSDLYSLGLILYEVFTGKRAIKAQTYAERLRTTMASPEPLSKHAPVDDAVERAVLRCLEHDAKARPASALAVSAALPGGDALAAAIAAGETPSPNMVAAAGGEGSLAVGTAWTLLGGVGVLMAAVLLMAPCSTDLGMAPSEKSPAVLRQQAREITAKFGYGKDAADSADWLGRDAAPLRYLANNMKAPDWRRKYKELAPPILYSYRQSPRPLVAPVPMFLSQVTSSIPPMEVSGMTLVQLDGNGRLRRFRAVPPQLEPENKPGPEFDWSPLFPEAGLDPERFQRVEPQWIPPVPFDARAEWTGSIPQLPEIPLRVSAAAFQGKLGHFEVLGPWSLPGRMQVRPPSLATRIGQVTGTLMILGLIATTLFFARRNLRQGRGDKTGALRLSVFVLIVALVQGMLKVHIAADLPFLISQVILPVMAFGIFFGVLCGLMYVALEPYLRRRMPELLIGWARLLEGRLRDPRIGSDVLVGGLFGAGLALLNHVVSGLSSWFAFPGQTTISPSPLFNAGGTNPLVYVLGMGIGPLLGAFSMMAMYFVFRVVLRKPALAVAALVTLNFLLTVGGIENVFLETPANVLSAALLTIVATRFGLLALVSCFVYVNPLTTLTPSLNSPGWFTTYSLPGLLLLVGLTLYAFRTSLGGQPMFGAAALED